MEAYAKEKLQSQWESSQRSKIVLYAKPHKITKEHHIQKPGRVKLTLPHNKPWYHRMLRVGRDHPVQPRCHGQGLSLDKLAQSPIQPDLEHCQAVKLHYLAGGCGLHMGTVD